MVKFSWKSWASNEKLLFFYVNGELLLTGKYCIVIDNGIYTSYSVVKNYTELSLIKYDLINLYMRDISA